MAQTEYGSYPRGEVPCSYHPGTMTGLRCGRCGKPICPQCAVRTPVGLRCPECAGVRGLPTYRTPSSALARALGTGILVAILVAIVWRFIPQFQFYLCLALGFGVVESMARFAGNKRGADLQIAAIAVVTFGLVLSRVLLAQRFGISFDQLNGLDSRVASREIIDVYGAPQTASGALQLELVPDLLFAVLAYAIAWIRFR